MRHDARERRTIVLKVTHFASKCSQTRENVACAACARYGVVCTQTPPGTLFVSSLSPFSHLTKLERLHGHMLKH